MMDPNVIQQVLNAGQFDPALEQARRKQATIDRLRERAMSSPSTQMAGRIALPNWGQNIANVVGGYQANRMQPGVDAAMQQASGRTVDARKQYLDALMMALRRPYPQQTAPVLPPDGMEDR